MSGCYHDMVERNVTFDLRIGEDLMVIEEMQATVFRTVVNGSLLLH